jgi:hypothetical protein
MPKALSAAAVLIAGAVLLGTSSARAVILLSLVNSPTTTDTLYDFSLTATAPTTIISIGGYDHPGFEYVWDISLTVDGGANLLGESWVRTPSASGSEATQSNGLLTFGDISSGNFATFSQTLATTPGDSYLLTFRFANSLDGSSFPSDPNELLVTTSSGLPRTLAVPELSTWTMALLGFVGLGLVGYRQARKTESRTGAA